MRWKAELISCYLTSLFEKEENSPLPSGRSVQGQSLKNGIGPGDTNLRKVSKPRNNQYCWFSALQMHTE
jgi:hypothetical protein